VCRGGGCDDAPVGDLADLLELLHDAEEPFSSLRARYRLWSHRDRAHAAFLAAAKQTGAAVFGVGAGGPPPSPESVEIVDIWRLEPDRARLEHSGGDRDGAVEVRVEQRWWHWDPRSGAMSNAEDPSAVSGTGHELATFLDPPSLLGALRFEPLGRGMRCARAVIVADAWPRPARHEGPPRFELHELGTGGDRYRLEVDAERGLVLAAQAFAGGEPFRVVEALELEVDEAIDEDVFVFRAPEGEEIRRPGFHGTVVRHTSIPEAQAAAPFTLLVPERVPSSWRVHCTSVGPSERPPRPATVSIHYHSDSGHESLSIVLRAIGEEPDPFEETNAAEWEEIRAGEYTARVCEPGWQSQLRLEHGGTGVLMLSETLSRDQLVAIAAMLVPAPPASQL
jgi:hypothetical protein